MLEGVRKPRPRPPRNIQGERSRSLQTVMSKSIAGLFATFVVSILASAQTPVIGSCKSDATYSEWVGNDASSFRRKWICGRHYLAIQAEGPTALGPSGCNLGYFGIRPSIAVKFDTWNNFQFETKNNHIAVLKNGIPIYLDSQSQGATSCNVPVGVFGCLERATMFRMDRP